MRSAVLGTLRLARVLLGAMRWLPVVLDLEALLPWLRAFWRARERADEEETFGGRVRGTTLRGPLISGLAGWVLRLLVPVEEPLPFEFVLPERPLFVGLEVG